MVLASVTILAGCSPVRCNYGPASGCSHRWYACDDGHEYRFGCDGYRDGDGGVIASSHCECAIDGTATHSWEVSNDRNHVLWCSGGDRTEWTCEANRDCGFNLWGCEP